MKITLTKAEALRIQAEHVAHYAKHSPGLAERVAAATTADQLEDGIQYDVVTINQHIPRGADIERMAGIPDQGGE
jgi:hypothetical protein